MITELLTITDLGRLAYDRAYELQVREVERVLADRAEAQAASAAAPPPVGTIFLVEHDAVVTITPRQSAAANLLATPELLARCGVTVATTDRGGDITYHGPGQLVVYPILDLNRLNLGLHAYMRLLEQAVIDTCAAFGVAAHRDATATGVWVTPSSPPSQLSSADAESEARTTRDSGDRRLGSLDPAPSSAGSTVPSSGTDHDAPPSAKVAAMGVRVRKWISMHGLALNVTTNLDHFNLIVPCGLAGRPVTSLEQLRGPACPSMPQVKAVLADNLERLIAAAHETALDARAHAQP